MAQSDFREAKSTYEGFIALFKWGTIAAALVTAFVIVIIS